MRNNQPVTTQEFVIPNDVFIYSRTNLKGVITEVNDAFADISGYLPEEMIGQPHNMIRHPDMPASAFSDMWGTLKAGKPWKGLVKNRRKNGDFYWVLANASPVREKGVVVGFQSVRSRPEREQVAAAEAAYQQIRSGSKSIRIQDGRIVKNRSPWQEQLISHESRLYGFITLAMLTEVTGVITDQGWLSFLLPVHDSMSALLLILSVYMLGYYLPKSFRRLKNIRDHLEKTLSSGDLTSSLVPEQSDLIDSISGRLDTQLSAMRATIQIIADSSREVVATTETLKGSVVTLADSAAHQSETTSAAAAGVEEITISIGEVAHHAQNTKVVAEEARRRAVEGASLSETATQTINTLSETVAHSAETVEQLGTRTEEVGRIASVIKDIADQTNLLALNAAIEAARAGEQGRGFAVVADEVRKLAERTAKATQEIDQMIARIQGDTDSAVSGMRSSADQVGESVQLVQRAQDTLRIINEEMVKTLDMVSEITHSSSEQSSAMHVMAQSVEQVAILTEENLKIVHSTDEASLTLQSSIDKMSKAVMQYKV